MDEHSGELQYRAFLSYRSDDRKLAEWLHRKLERYRIPKRLVGKTGPHGPVPRRLAPIFRDRDDARSAGNLNTTIAKFLAKSRYLIVLCTPSAVAPESWVGREIEIFRRERPDAEIFAAIGGGEPPACFPQQLLTLGPDGCWHAPLAADLRPANRGGDGRRKGVVKLIAAIAGVDFDDLWQREKRWRLLQFSILMVFVVGLLVAAISWLQQRESSRLAAIGRAAEKIDRSANAEVADLMLIAAAPPPFGAAVLPDPVQVEGIRATARRFRPSFAGFIAQEHSELNTHIVAISQDGRFVFSKNDYDGGLFVWDAPRNRLVARLPMDPADWLIGKRSPRSTSQKEPLAMSIARDGRTVAAVYSLGVAHAFSTGENAPLLVEHWHLDTNGSCPALCLPETFSFMRAQGAHDWTGPNFSGTNAGMQLTADGKEALYIESGSATFKLDLTKSTATPLTALAPEDQSRCTLALPEPPPRPIAASPFGLPTLDSAGDSDKEAFWFDADGQSLARMSFAHHMLAFYSKPAGREVARLNFPKDTECVLDCSIDVVFLGHGRRALVANKNGRVYGILDLSQCRFDAWPIAPLASFLANSVSRPKGRTWEVHRVEAFRASPDERFVAAVLTLSADNYRTLGVIYDLRERRPIALFDPLVTVPDLDEIQSLATRGGAFPFQVIARNASVPIRSDGTPGHIAKFDVASLMDPHQPAWEWSTRNAAEANQWRFVDPRTGDPSQPLDFYGERVRTAISRDGKLLALGQANVVLLQPADTKALGEARRLDAAYVRKLLFSPESHIVAALSNLQLGNDSSTMIQAWRVADGQSVGQQTTPPGTELLAVSDDGNVILETSGEVKSLDLRTGALGTLFNASGVRVVSRPSDLLAADRTGRTWTIDKSFHATPSKQIEFLRGKDLVDVSWNGRTVYASDFNADYILDLQNGNTQRFLAGTQTRASTFARDGRFAIVAKVNNTDEIQIWSPIGPTRLVTYQGDWNSSDSILSIWFSNEERELWALDGLGKLHRWTLTGEYAKDFAEACLGLREAGARTEMTDAEIAGLPQLRVTDKAPCLRVGPLSLDYYRAIAHRALDAITDKGAAWCPADCDKRHDPKSAASCRMVFEERWKALERTTSLKR